IVDLIRSCQYTRFCRVDPCNQRRIRSVGQSQAPLARGIDDQQVAGFVARPIPRDGKGLGEVSAAGLSTAVEEAPAGRVHSKYIHAARPSNKDSAGPNKVEDSSSSIGGGCLAEDPSATAAGCLAVDPSATAARGEPSHSSDLARARGRTYNRAG